MPPKKRVVDDDDDEAFVPSDTSDSDSDEDDYKPRPRGRAKTRITDTKTDFVFSLHTRLPEFLTAGQQELLELVPLVTVAELAQRALSERPARLVNDSDIGKYFGHLTPVAAGAYGVVMQGCVRAVNAAACQRFTIPEGGIVAPVIVKLAWQAPRPSNPRKLTWPLSDKGKWTGGSNATREALLGKMLSHLVTAGISPNFLSLYNIMEVTRPPVKMGDVFQTLNKFKEYMSVLRKNGSANAAVRRMPTGTTLLVIAMEECAMDLAAFLNKELFKHPRTTDVLRSLFCQVAAGLLAADTRYGFRHNDLHAKNVMVTSTDTTLFYYRVQGKLYAVPTYGLCWKIVDYGLGASDTLFAPLDAAYVHAASNVSLSWGLENRCNPRHAVELYDLSRLVNDTLASMRDRRYPAAAQSWLKTHVDAVLERVSAATPERHAGQVQRCIDAAHARIRKLRSDTQRRDAETALAHGVAKVTKSHGLLAQSFAALAQPFMTTKTPPSNVPVYDHASKVTINNVSFEGMLARK